MSISKEGVDITKRFFEAIDMLIASKKIRGVKTFTDMYNINRRNFITIKNNPENSILKTEYLLYLVRDFNFNAHWLITGNGGMFAKQAK
ncbi:MAG: hypothetical protein ACK5MH_09165 [Bacteroidales bacterium]